MADPHREVTHELEDGFVVAWDTNEVSEDLRDSMREIVDQGIDSLSDALELADDPPARAAA